ncbi:MAG: gluconokinase [Chloroflexota bacterium]
MHNQQTILTIDLGTSSIRAMLFDTQANALPGYLAQLPNKLETSVDGKAEFNGQDYFQTAVSVIDQLLAQVQEQAYQGITIGAVAIASMVSNVMGVNEAGEIVTPLYIYGDTRSRDDAQVLRDELGTQGLAEAHNRTGCLLHTSYLPPRFLWLQRTDPALLDRVDYWMSIGEYLLWQLTGTRAVSYSVASWSGLLNRQTLTWDATWLDRLPISAESLSPLADVTQPLTGLQDAWADRWPMLADVPWLPAIGDGAAANLGSGCDTPQRVAITIGTTGAMRVVVDPTLDVVPAGLWLYRVDAGRGLLGGATTEGGNFFAWLNQTLRLPPGDQLTQQLLALPPAAHGLTILPFISGERAPGWNDNARPVIHGFNMDTSAVEIVQAALESIAYRFAIIYGRVQPYLDQAGNYEIIASGGALLRSPAWLQMMADVFNQPVVSLAETEITARGLAVLALDTLNYIEQGRDLPPATGRVYTPDTGRHHIHTEALTRQTALYGRLFG